MFYTNVAKYGKNILYRGYDDNGKRIEKKIAFEPTLFVETHEYSEWKSLYGHNIKPRKFKTMKGANEFISKYSDVDNLKIFGNSNFVIQFISEFFAGKIDYDRKHIRIGNIDIEVYSEDGFPHPDEANFPITSIAYKDSKLNKYKLWAYKTFDIDQSNYDVDFIQCDDENHLLRLFVDFMEEYSPDILTGWNIELFDVPYLVHRISKILGDKDAKRLSPWGIINRRSIWLHNKDNIAYDIVGVSQIDYMNVFKKFGYTYGPQETYSLDNIASVILGEKKLSYDEYGSLFKLYRENPQKYFEYNIRDVHLVDLLDKETCLLDIVLSVAYKAGSNYKDTLGTVSIWDSILYRKLIDEKVVVPFPATNEKVKYPGGYVKEPKPGMYKWVVSFDLASLYPSIIAQNNMSPETIEPDRSKYLPNSVDYYLNKSNEVNVPDDRCVCANGVLFKKDKLGVIPSIIIDYFAERQEVKKEMIRCQNLKEKATTDAEKERLKHEINLYDNQQMTIKILMNSLYGAIGNIFFRFYDLRIAEGITLTGQLAIKWAERAVNDEMNRVNGTKNVDYVIAIDTDSLYIDMSNIVEKYNPDDPVQYVNDACEKHFQKIINKAYADLYDRMNSRLKRLVMDREIIADRGIWTSKKHYILNVLDKEGVRYTDPKLKIMGIEAVKSSTPAICRKALKDTFKILMMDDQNELKGFLRKFEKEFKSGDPEDVASPRGISDMDKWIETSPNAPYPYKKGTPLHVKGAIMYNKKITDMGLEKQYDLIQNGDKIKYCYLKLPNPLKEKVIAFPQYIPKELNLHQYVDYNVLYEKNFKSVLRGVTSLIGWDIDNKPTLDSLYK